MAIYSSANAFELNLTLVPCGLGVWTVFEPCLILVHLMRHAILIFSSVPVTYCKIVVAVEVQFVTNFGLKVVWYLIEEY